MYVLCSHCQINSRVNAERSVLGWERPAGIFHDNRVPGADVAIDDKLMIEATLCACVVWFTDRQEVGRETSRHHLARVDEDVCGKQTECKHTWDTHRHRCRTMRIYSMKALKRKINKE